MTDSTPGWQPDPTGRHDHRYWDGSRWTDDVADAGVAAKDPYDGPADAAPGTGDERAADAAESPTAGSGGPGEEPTVVGPAPQAEPTTVSPTPEPEPTAAWPAAGSNPPPPSYSAPPPPTAPVAPAAAAASGGSKKGLMIGVGVLVLVALAVGAFLLLGGDDDSDRDRIRAGLISALNEDGDFTDEEAGCMADHLIDEIGEDKLEGVDFTADEPPAEIEDEFFAAAFSAMSECDIDMGGFGGDDGGTDDGSADDGMTDDSATDDGGTDDAFGDDGDFGTDFGTDDAFGAEFEEMLADIYADSFGISQEKAECLAGKIADAMDSGELGEEEMMSDIFEYFEECDISMSEISGGGG